MKLIDEELRASLHERADRLAPPLDVFTQVEAKAHRIKRNRMAASVAGAVAAVAAIAIVVPTLTSSPSHHVGPAGQGGTSTAPSTPSHTQTPPPATDKNALDPAAPWAYRGDQKAIRPATLEKFRQDWAAKYPGSTLQPLWGDIYEPSQQPEVVFVAKVGDGARWGMAMGGDTTAFVVDQPLAAGTKVLAAAVPGDEVARLLAVAAPTTKAIQYAPDGVTFTDMAMIALGVGVDPLEGNQTVDRLKVVGADGATVYEGPAPDSAATNTPGNVLAWPSRDKAPGTLLQAAQAFYAQSRQQPGASVSMKVLYGGVDAAGTQYLLAQAWLPGDTSADTVGYLKHSDGSVEPQLLARLDVSTAVAALDVTDVPLGGNETLVVVPQPTTGQVLYAADGKIFKPVNGDQSAVVLISRAAGASSDRLRVLDGDGKTTFNGSVSSLLCGVSSCG
jgi:hypothetical protein